MKRVFLLLFSSLLLLGGACSQKQVETFVQQDSFSSSPMQRVSFQASDGVTIVGSYIPAEQASMAVALFHMMPADRASWSSFQQKLSAAGIASIAIDLRGHGESTQQDQAHLDYLTFSDNDHQQSIRDLDATIDFLKAKGFDEKNIILGGASIGANLALQYLSEHSTVPKAFLLSPGLDFRGIKTVNFAQSLTAHQSFLAAASQDDAYSFDTITQLVARSNGKGKKLEYDNLGHGTALFEKDPNVMDSVIEWIKK